MKLASEGAMREMTRENMNLDIEVENVPMSFPQLDSGNDVKLAPLVQITDLQEAICSTLDKHQRYGIGRQNQLST